MSKAPATHVQHWQAHITAWQQSGLSQSAYCRQHHLVISRFGYWQRKLNKTAPSGFTQVLTEPQAKPSFITLQMPNGIEIQGIDEQTLPLVSLLLDQLR